MTKHYKKILTYVLYISIIIYSLVFVSSCNSDSDKIKLRNGDLLFLQENSNDDFTKAINDATKSIKDYNFSHVGIAYKENNKWYVLEAIQKGVSQSPIKDFISPREVIDSLDNINLYSSTIIVGRLKSKYTTCIPSAIKRIKTLIGKPYDIYFNANNDLYYCSELIQQNYIFEGKPIFPYIDMTFKNQQNGKIDLFWIKHFADLHVPIPEGKPGSNPGELSKSFKINILGQITIKDFK